MTKPRRGRGRRRQRSGPGSGRVQNADAAPADAVPVGPGLESLLLRVDLLQLPLRCEPVAKLVGEEVALAAAGALDEGVGVEQLQAAAR